MVTIEVIKHFAINRIIIVKGMIPELDVMIRKTKSFVLAERRYLGRCVGQFNEKRISFETFNKKLVLVLIK